jgi:hypothetical protein
VSRSAADTGLVAAFADREHGTWGVILGGEVSRLAAGRLDQPSEVRVSECRLAPAGEDGWTCEGGGASLSFVPAWPAIGTPETAGKVELYRVTGELGIDGDSVTVDGGGASCTALPEGRIDSVRVVLASFGPEEGVGLQAVRPAKARGQDRDALAVTLLRDSDELMVFDPRLSTTYSQDGTPRRTGIELWLGENEEGDVFSHRMAGESTGAEAKLTGPDLELAAHALRCHGHGEDGAGVYLLIRPR